jgi:hypothetical protein
MSARTAAWITWGGGGAIAAATLAGLVLTLLYGESVFAARLVSGFVNCL